VSAFAGEIGGDPRQVGDIALAVTEACANVAVHAYRDADPPGQMEIVATEGEGALKVQVIDHGMGLFPRCDSPGIGLGMPLMSHLSDKFETQTSEGVGTEVCMQFNLE